MVLWSMCCEDRNLVSVSDKSTSCKESFWQSVLGFQVM